MDEKIEYKLPKNLKPYFYNLTIKPYIGPFYGLRSSTFDGNLSLSFTCQIPTDKIIIHSKNLTIQSIKIKNLNNQLNNLFTIGKADYDEIRDFLIIKINQLCVRNNNYTISIDYWGLLSDTLTGFYQNSYLDSNGNIN